MKKEESEYLKTENSLGEKAYELYAKALKKHSGKETPTWNELDNGEKLAWNYATLESFWLVKEAREEYYKKK